MSSSKRACNLGKVVTVAEHALLQVLLEWVDSWPEDQDEYIIYFGAYVKKGRGIYDVSIMMHNERLLVGMIRAAHVTRFLATQLRSVLESVVDQRSKRKIYRSKKFPLKAWCRIMAGALMDLVADVRNLSYRTVRYQNTMKKLKLPEQRALDTFLDMILATSLDAQPISQEERDAGVAPVASARLDAPSSSSAPAGDGAKKRKLESHVSAASDWSVNSAGIPKVFLDDGDSVESEAERLFNTGRGDESSGEELPSNFAEMFADSDEDAAAALFAVDECEEAPTVEPSRDALIDELHAAAVEPVDSRKGALKKLVCKKRGDASMPVNDAKETSFGWTVCEFYRDVSYIRLKKAAKAGRTKSSYESIVSCKNPLHHQIIALLWKKCLSGTYTKKEMNDFKQALQVQQESGLPLELEGVRLDPEITALADQDSEEEKKQDDTLYEEEEEGVDFWAVIGNSSDSD